MKISYAPESTIAQSPTWLYRDFDYRALQISQKLQQQNIRSIAIWLEDAAHLACVLLGAWHANVRVLFPPDSTPESIEWANSFSDLWITDHPIAQASSVLFDDFAKDVELAKLSQNRPLFEPDNQTEIWLKTSGSTGEAKTIVKTAEQMWLSADILAQDLPFAADNNICALSSVSIQHIYGLTVHIMMSLVQGWTLSRKQQFYPEYIQAESNKTLKTVLISSPAMLSRINWQTLKFPKIIGVISSGGALTEEVSDEIRQQLKNPVVEIYGSTETGPIATRKDIGLWHPMPRSRVGTDERGALWLEADWTSERQQTADAVEFYQDGFALLGRIDRIVKIGDKRTSLVKIEQQLVKHQWVVDCYIGQYPEQQRLAAWVELSAEGIEIFRSQGRKSLIDQLKQYLAEYQDKSAIPRFWRFTDKLPRNSQSKISRLEFERVCVEPQLDPIWHDTQSIDENTVVFSGKVPLDLQYFKGHFANFPLVPGVIEVQWVADKMADFFAIDKSIIRIDNLKFQKFLRPNDELELTLKWNKPKNRMEFQLKTTDDMCGKGFIIFAE